MFEDRAYQIESVDYVMAEADNKSSRPILCAPTGSGKTVICAKVAKEAMDAGRTFGILTPREEILYQMRDTMMEVCGATNVGVLKAGEFHRRDLPIQVISWPTLLARTAKTAAWFPDVDMLAIDECHLALSPKMSERILPYYEPRSKVFGVTATPARKSGRGLGSFFSHIKHVTTVRQLVADGKLAPLEYFAGKQSDISRVPDVGGDFNQKKLSAACMPLIGDVLDKWGQLASDRHTLVFAVDIPHCEALTERFQQAGIAAASLHHHKTPERRQEIVRQFKARKIQVLVNVTIASYGFDAPSVDCIVLARPTKSVVLWLQMLGRGMRTHDGKEFCLVIDHTNGVRNPELGYADDLRRWRLDKGRKASGNWSRDERNKDKKEGEDKVYECDECSYLFSRSQVCPKCGWEVPMPKRDIETVDAEFVRVSRQESNTKSKDWPDDHEFYLMLRHYAENRPKPYKPGWAYHKFREKTGRMPLRRWDDDDTVPPSVRVANWIRSRQIAFIKSREKKQAVA